MDILEVKYEFGPSVFYLFGPSEKKWSFGFLFIRSSVTVRNGPLQAAPAEKEKERKDNLWTAFAFTSAMFTFFPNQIRNHQVARCLLTTTGLAMTFWTTSSSTTHTKP